MEFSDLNKKKQFKIKKTVMNKLQIWGIAVALLVLAMVGMRGCERIDAGHVGLKVDMTGGNQGVGHQEYVTGWCFYWRPFQKVYEFPTFQQHKEYEPSQIPTKGGNNVFYPPHI